MLTDKLCSVRSTYYDMSMRKTLSLIMRYSTSSGLRVSSTEKTSGYSSSHLGRGQDDFLRGRGTATETRKSVYTLRARWLEVPPFDLYLASGGSRGTSPSRIQGQSPDEG